MVDKIYNTFNLDARLKIRVCRAATSHTFTMLLYFWWQYNNLWKLALHLKIDYFLQKLTWMSLFSGFNVTCEFTYVILWKVT